MTEKIGTEAFRKGAGVRIRIERSFDPEGVAAILAFECTHYGRAMPTSKKAVIERLRSHVENFGDSMDDNVSAESEPFIEQARDHVANLFPEWRR